MSLLFGTTAIGFVLLTALFYGLVLRHLRAALVKTGWTEEKQKRIRTGAFITIMVWSILVAAVALTGLAGKFELFPLNIAPMLFIPLAGILWITFSARTKEILKHVPIRALTSLQVFRVFVEILLWMLFIQNLLPEQMTFEGRNFDILAGITAPLMAYFFSENRRVMIVWNLLSLALLINIVTIAILSMPSPFRVFFNEPGNTIVTTFPFIFLPTFLVPLAYGLHFFSLRKLLMKE
ncbi:MAG: hypothetical protein QY309_15715 [Cyclobacteriaceae bacterium]|nr:MAG: hypothetical protein QY309_15715 [Cyclobacteriaceae bacterium]